MTTKGLVPLTLEAVHFGRAVTAFNERLAFVCADVVARARMGGARKVTLEISVTPDLEAEDVEGSTPAVDWSVKYSVPGARGTTTMAFVEGGELLVSPASDDPRQTTIDEIELDEADSNVSKFPTTRRSTQ